MLAQQRGGREDHPRRAVTALKRFFIQKRLLYRTKSASTFQPFDGRNLCARGGCGPREAGSSRGSVNKHGASTALSLSATIFCACQMELVA